MKMLRMVSVRMCLLDSARYGYRGKTPIEVDIKRSLLDRNEAEVSSARLPSRPFEYDAETRSSRVTEV